MIFLYFVRHLPTQSNTKNLWCGRKTDLHIDKNKSTQIVTPQQLDFFWNHKFDYVFVSPMIRCLETYDFFKIKTPKKIDDRIIEREFGQLEQTPCDDKIKKLLANLQLNTDLSKGVEKINDIFHKRLIPFINDIKKLPDGSHVLIISHSWIGRLLKYYFSNNQNDINEAPKNGEILKFKLKK